MVRGLWCLPKNMKLVKGEEEIKGSNLLVLLKTNNDFCLWVVNTKIKMSLKSSNKTAKPHKAKIIWEHAGFGTGTGFLLSPAPLGEHRAEQWTSSWGCGALWRCLSSGCSSLHAVVTTSSCILKIGRCGEKPFVHSTLCSHSCELMQWHLQALQLEFFRRCRRWNYSSAESHVPKKHEAPMNDNIIVRSGKIFLFAKSFCGSF